MNGERRIGENAYWRGGSLVAATRYNARSVNGFTDDRTSGIFLCH